MERSCEFACFLIPEQIEDQYNKYSRALFEQSEQYRDLGFCLKPQQLLAELLQSTAQSQAAFVSVFKEFSVLTDADIFECLLIMANNISISEDAEHKLISQTYFSVKDSSLTL